MGGLAPRRDEVREEKRKVTEGTRARESWRDARENEWEKEKSNERYKEGVKKRVRKNERERERRKRTRLGAMCIGERIHIVRFGGKVFGQVQGDAAAAAAAAGSLLSSRCASLCPLILSLSHHLVSSLLLYEDKPPLSLSLSFSFSFFHDFALARRDCSFRFVFRL